MIYTHSGPFHADDVFAVAVDNFLGGFGPDQLRRNLTRTRDAAVLARFNPATDMMIDVGGRYAPDERRFDHHFADSPRRDNGVPYAAFGMVWRAYGPGVVLLMPTPDRGRVFAPPEVAEIVARVDRSFVQPIDAGDTGTTLVADPTPTFDGVLPFTIAHAISAFNRPDGTPAARQDGAFIAAVEWATSLLILVACQATEHGHKLAAVRKQVDVHLAAAAADCLRYSRRVLILTEAGPWQEVALEDDRCLDLLYVVFPSNGQWMVQCVPDAPGSFGKRKPMPADWAGLRDAAIAGRTGVDDAVFCHPGRFIAGAQTLDGAAALADLAVAAV